MPPDLVDDLFVEIFLRLPSDDPACLLRTSLVCKRWRRILADPAFLRRHRELYPAPSVFGFVQVVRDQVPYFSRFVPINPASGGPTGRDLPGWLALDCRHGRALFVTPATGPHIDDGEEEGATLDFVVWDPLTDERRRLPRPSPAPHRHNFSFKAAVLCAAASESCDHRGCHGGPFRVAFVYTTWVDHTGFVTSASMYSSETGVWSGPTSVEHHDMSVVGPRLCRFSPILVGDTNTLYFHSNKSFAFEYQLGVQRLSVIDLPPHLPQYLANVDGKLCFFDVKRKPSLSLCLWSQETAPNGVAVWVRSRVINLEALLPSDAFLAPPNQRWLHRHPITGSAEGTDVILLATPASRFHANVYMVELNSGRAKKMADDLSTVYPYTSYCIPVIDSGSTGEGLEKGISCV